MDWDAISAERGAMQRERKFRNRTLEHIAVEEGALLLLAGGIPDLAGGAAQ